MEKVAQLDLTIRHGTYQPLAAYEVFPATAAMHRFIPASEANQQARAAVVAALESAGFVLDTGNYVSAEHAAQARICVDGVGEGATIGVEIWDEPNAAKLLGTES